MAADSSYWSDVIPRALARTWDLLDGKPLAATIVAGFIFLVAFVALWWLRGKKHDVKDRIAEAAMGLSAIIIIGAMILLYQVFIGVPREDYKQLVASKSAAEELRKSQAGKTEEVAKLKLQTEAMEKQLNTVSLVYGLNATGNVREKLDTFLQEFEETKKAVKNLEASVVDPLDESIVTAGASAVVLFISQTRLEPGKSPAAGGGLAILWEKDQALLLAVTSEGFTSPLSNGRARHEFSGRCLSTNPFMYQPIRGLLHHAQYMQLYFASGSIPVGTKILGGQVTWVFNSRTTLKFNIPEQVAVIHPTHSDRTVITLSDLSAGFAPLAAAPKKKPTL